MFIFGPGILLSMIHTKFFNNLASSLYALTHKDAEFYWGQPEQIAFDRLKQLLINAPVLAFPNFD